eukprot:TRINITY_DN13616_c1_g2_i1.p1 TRINITY_DN13616_c1_g2~~TRINITY_DN13616_c1_g2_i1.p1  ORF type:complete len:958 (+),score=120.78 TRINITY_DN13616_c1_g2_i1:82-2874(+)
MTISSSEAALCAAEDSTSRHDGSGGRLGVHDGKRDAEEPETGAGNKEGPTREGWGGEQEVPRSVGRAVAEFVDKVMESPATDRDPLSAEQLAQMLAAVGRSALSPVIGSGESWIYAALLAEGFTQLYAPRLALRQVAGPRPSVHQCAASEGVREGGFSGFAFCGFRDGYAVPLINSPGQQSLSHGMNSNATLCQVLPGKERKNTDDKGLQARQLQKKDFSGNSRPEAGLKVDSATGRGVTTPAQVHGGRTLSWSLSTSAAQAPAPAPAGRLMTAAEDEVHVRGAPSVELRSRRTQSAAELNGETDFHAFLSRPTALSTKVPCSTLDSPYASFSIDAQKLGGFTNAPLLPIAQPLSRAPFQTEDCENRGNTAESEGAQLKGSACALPAEWERSQREPANAISSMHESSALRRCSQNYLGREAALRDAEQHHRAHAGQNLEPNSHKDREPCDDAEAGGLEVEDVKDTCETSPSAAVAGDCHRAHRSSPSWSPGMGGGAVEECSEETYSRDASHEAEERWPGDSWRERDLECCSSSSGTGTEAGHLQPENHPGNLPSGSDLIPFVTRQMPLSSVLAQAAHPLNAANTGISPRDKAYLDEMRRMNSATEAKIALSRRKLALAGEQLRVSERQIEIFSTSNSLKSDSIHLQHGENLLRAHEAGEKKAAKALQQLSCALADELLAGMAVLLFTLVLCGWQGYARLAEGLTVCRVPEKAGPRSFFTSPFQSLIDPTAVLLRATLCHVMRTGHFVFGALLLIAGVSVVISRPPDDYQRRPVFGMIISLGLLCGLFGMKAVESVGGKGLTWLLFWELLCAIHTFAAWFPDILFLILHGKKAEHLAVEERVIRHRTSTLSRSIGGCQAASIIDQQVTMECGPRRRKWRQVIGGCLWLMWRAFFHVSLVFILPVAGGVLPFWPLEKGFPWSVNSPDILVPS